MSWQEGASCGKNIRPVNHFVVGNMDNSFLCQEATISANGKSFIPFPCRGHSIVLVKFASSKGVWIFVCCGFCSLIIYSSSLIMSINFIYFLVSEENEWLFIFFMFVLHHCHHHYISFYLTSLFPMPSNHLHEPTPPSISVFLYSPSPLNGAGLLSKLHLLQSLFIMMIIYFLFLN